MRDTPAEFSKGPKATVEKLNLLVKSVRENTIIPGVGLRIRETANGVLLTLDERILLAAGLANSDQKFREAGDGKKPFGSAPTPIGETEKPANENPADTDWDGSGGSGTGGTGGGAGNTGDTQTALGIGPLRITSPNFITADVLEAFDYSFSAAGGKTTNWTWSLTGSLPSGLSFVSFNSRSGGRLVGTPADGSNGEYSLIVTVTNGGETASLPVALTVYDFTQLRLSIDGGSGSSVISRYWFEPFSPIPVSVRGVGIPPYTLSQIGGDRTAMQFVASGSGGNIVANQPSALTVSPWGGSTGNQSWNEWLASLTLQNLSVPQGNIFPYNITVRVTDSTGQTAQTTVTINASINLSDWVVTTSLGGPRWVPRSQAQANNWFIAFPI